MSPSGLFPTLAFTAAGIGSLHTLAPDHWAPFAAVARARGWSAGRTARVTFLSGFGHVTVTVALGVLAVFFGHELIIAFGQRLESLAGLLLIGFGLVYGLWGLRSAAGRRVHGHAHARYDHVHDPERATEWSLILLFSSDPCVALIPLLAAAAPLGTAAITGVALVYEAATIGTMLALVLPARLGAQRVRLPWLDRYGDALAGGFISAVGVLVLLLGI